MTDSKLQALTRWRLVLGHFAEDKIPCELSGLNKRIDSALDYIYSKEYGGRSIRSGQQRGANLDPSYLTIPHWLNEVRELFPKETIELIEKHALDRYGMTDLLTDKQVLAKLEPNLDLLKIILTFRTCLKQDVLVEARRIVERVVNDLKRKLETEVNRVLSGRLNRFKHSPVKVAQNLDWRSSILQNLKYYDQKKRKIGIKDVRFFSRHQMRMPWHLILCIDQSGSMASSVIHSAVLAGILAKLPMLSLKLIVFDTSVLDLSEHVDDPVEILMKVQLGGGTNIGQALTYCETLISDPQRTVLVLISDFVEGASPQNMIASCHRLREGGVKLLGLAALSEEANPSYDKAMAEKLASAGMEIAALTPDKFANWLAGVIR